MSTQIIKETINEFLGKMGVEIKSLSIEDSELPEYTKFLINTPDSGILIGKDGEHLLALAYILRKVVEKKFDNDELPKFFIDVGGYQANKIQKIQKVAQIMADRATTFKRDIELPPMSAYERMVIHSTLSETNNIATESEGQGRFRRVIVRYTETMN